MSERIAANESESSFQSLSVSAEEGGKYEEEDTMDSMRQLIEYYLEHCEYSIASFV